MIRGYEFPEWLWAIVGDIPSVLPGVRRFPTPHAALTRYIEGVEKWLAASPRERKSGGIIPIEVPYEPEWVEALTGRIKTLRTLVPPHLTDE
jgi:hypothetical protein